ncbi:hypothetical protein Q8A67_015744 [Cirrhinus molitorella]|uniref:Chromosomal protein D1-like n=1 Tax=Cirrhinus molitorella TaxID=172907 RepID=A0AA88PLR3_9TELE|nr:hypothetical protein Q8A67_015744 [Cirrhinus molitorella]
MEVDNKGSESPLPNGSTHPPKRGRGRPRGSLKKKTTAEEVPRNNARPLKKVDFFSPEVAVKAKVKKRGRPKKIKMPGRPRKVPLTPEEESERLQRLTLQRKRRLSKPLGRPRIHPVSEGSKGKRGRGRPRLNPAAEGRSGKPGRGRPRGSLNKKGRPSKKGDNFSPVVKRGRPKKIKLPGRPRKIPLTPEEESERLQRLSLQRKQRLSKPLGRPRIHPIAEGPKVKRARGRPRKSGTKSDGAKPASAKITPDAANGPPRKRGRPSGSLKKKRGRPAGSAKAASGEKEGTPTVNQE